MPPAERLRRTLDAYLAFVDEASDRFRALYLAGLGADPEVRAIRDRDPRSSSTDRRGRRPPPGPPALRAALVGWLSFIEGVSLDWLEHRDVTREQLRDFLLGALGGGLAAAGAAELLA